MKNDDTSRVSIFNDVADYYDQYRLEAPTVVTDILIGLLGRQIPDCVVDFGAGTGLSTCVWIDKALEVIGVEPNDDMRGQAIKRLERLSHSTEKIHFEKGDASQTGLPDGCTDIVTCSDALHWMEPVATFNEVNRVLRPNGVFGAFALQGCPTIHSQLEIEYQKVEKRAHEVRKERNLWEDVETWPLNLQLDHMRACGIFSFVKETWFHNQKMGNADQFIGWALSTGIVRGVLKSGVSEDDIGVPGLRDAAEQVIGRSSLPWFASYRMIVGVKNG